MLHWQQRFADDCIRVGYSLPDEQRLYPPYELYCCSQCCRLLSEKESSNEIDFYYCTQCIEALTLSEAAEYGHNCYRCFLCPVCTHVLTYISSRAPIKEEDPIPESKPSKKTAAPAATTSKRSALLRRPATTSKASSKSMSKATETKPATESPTTPTDTAEPQTKPALHYRLDCGHCSYSTAQLPQLDNTSVENLVLSVAAARKESPGELFVSDIVNFIKKQQRQQDQAPQATTPSEAEGDSEKKWIACEEALKLKEQRRVNLSIWDEWKIEFSPDAAPHGPAIKASDFLSLAHPQTRGAIAQLYASIDTADVSLYPGVPQRALAFSSSPLSEIHQLLPVPKRLVVKASKRCGQCKRFLVRHAMNPLQAPRLNSCATNTLPRLFIFGIHQDGTSLKDFLETATEQTVAERFPKLKARDAFNLVFEVCNTTQMNTTVNLLFNQSDNRAFTARTQDTICSDVQTIKLELDGFDEYSKDATIELLVPYRDADGELSANVAANGFALQKMGARGLVVVRARVSEGVGTRALLQLSVGMRMESTTFTAVLEANPVFVLGRTA